MGADQVYFAAAGDTEAAEALIRPGGPLGWPEVVGHRRVGFLRKEPVVTELGPAYDGFAVDGYDPVVSMGTLEALLTGRSYDAVAEHPRQGGTVSPDPPEGRLVVTLTDTLRDALASADDDRLADVARAWGETEELADGDRGPAPAGAHLEFLRRLRALARRATDSGQSLYCYWTW